ncbi:50S ribosomal protein L4, partial [Arthrospira platensis SPKY1]|nr:50S ribosomal protein L4 [Arthrospira platensis SPKY1]
RVFGPRPRDYGFKLNKKVKRLARRSALSVKAGAGQILIVEDFSFETPKTKKFLEILQNLGVAGKKTVFVTADLEMEVLRSSQNVPKTQVARAADLNTYQ